MTTLRKGLLAGLLGVAFAATLLGAAALTSNVGELSDPQGIELFELAEEHESSNGGT